MYMPTQTQSPLKTYLDHLERGELAYQFSPGPARVRAATVVHPPEGAPFNVALIDCDEGFRLMSRVEDIPPADVKIGMRVHFRVHRPGGEEPPCPVFVPEGKR